MKRLSMVDVFSASLPFSPFLPWGLRTYIMGVINLTPDSFSGDGLLAGFHAESAQLIDMVIQKARQFVDEGADILDVGGESTRPGAVPVSVEEELARVVPVVKALSQAGIKALISVDTSKAPVADAALKAGAQWVNDVWSLTADPAMAKVVQKHHAPVILMHNRSKGKNDAGYGGQVSQTGLGGRYIGAKYSNLIEDIKAELLASISLAHAAGIEDRYIILDPGIGFGKTVEQNLELVDRLGEFRALGYPLLVGPSRKSFIGYSLNLPPEERLAGTAAAVTTCIARGADIIRVHDVAFMVRVAKMTDAIVRRGPRRD
jgi:dihydropteroate synthase